MADVALPEQPTISLAGKTFRRQETLNEFLVMEFSVEAANVDEKSMAGMQLVYALVKDCIVPEDWEAFKTHARESRATIEQLMEVVTELFQASTERPTVQPADSSAGLLNTEVNSTTSSSIEAIRHLESLGRPDLALVVSNANAA